MPTITIFKDDLESLLTGEGGVDRGIPMAQLEEWLMLVKGEAELIRRISYAHVEQDEIFDLPGVVSRKKQLIPYLTSLIKEMAADGTLPTGKSAAPFGKKRK